MMPDVQALPVGTDIKVESYASAYSFWLDGKRRRVYISCFEYISFTLEEARPALHTLWLEVELLESSAEVERVVARRLIYAIVIYLFGKTASACRLHCRVR